VKRLCRIEIVAFRQRTIVVGDQNQSDPAARRFAGCRAEVRFALSRPAPVEPPGRGLEADHVGLERPTSNLLLKTTRQAIGRVGTWLNILRTSRSHNHGGHNEH
jgi:hypothetical protein